MGLWGDGQTLWMTSLYQLWRFIAPALSDREKRWAYPLAGVFTLLFVFGVAIGYFALERGLVFLLDFGGDSLRPLIGVDALGEVSSARRLVVRFQGRNGSMSFGTRLPAAAQLSRYQESQRRGLMFHCFNVATIENMAAVRQTLQSEPEP